MCCRLEYSYNGLRPKRSSIRPSGLKKWAYNLKISQNIMFIKKYFELAYDYLFKGISKENFLFNGDAQIINASLSFL